MHYDPDNADMFVYVRRQSGTLLSSLGHDLKIRVGEFAIDADLDAAEIDVQIDAASLEPVDAIIWDSRDETGELSAGDRHEIAQRIRNEVLEVDTYPTIKFEAVSVTSINGGWNVTGPVILHGEASEIEVRVVPEDDRLHAETTIDQTEFDITPYSAMLGSLKVHPEVIVTVDAPAPEGLKEFE